MKFRKGDRMAMFIDKRRLEGAVAGIAVNGRLEIRLDGDNDSEPLLVSPDLVQLLVKGEEHRQVSNHILVTAREAMGTPLEEPVANGGLSVCKCCGLAEGCLTTDCPEVESSADFGDAVYAGEKDFRDGAWVDAASPHCPAGQAGGARREDAPSF